jgi:hypothetical protein
MVFMHKLHPATPHLSFLLHFDALQELASFHACVILAGLKNGDCLVQQEVGNDEPT